MRINKIGKGAQGLKNATVTTMTSTNQAINKE